jgi:hypothetical protein
VSAGWTTITLAALSLGVALGALDTAPGSHAQAASHEPTKRASACAGARAPLPDALMLRLKSGAFPGGDHPDVAVHVPAGFDATRRPGLVVYFHGWQGCVGAALSADDVPCDDAALPRSGADLAHQIDAARVNAILVAIELRVDAPTGEPGQTAMPAGARDLLQELFADHLAGPLGCTVPIDALDRIVLVAHSGGYQALASVVARGDLPQVTEVDLLDALYGVPEVFLRWIADDVERFDPRQSAGLRFVDLYTCCGGTADRSLWMAGEVKSALARVGLEGAIRVDDRDGELDSPALASPVVFKRVPRPHGELPRAYMRALIEAAGFARIPSSL